MYSKSCWNKLYILGYMWIFGHKVELLKKYRILHVTNNDADQLSDGPTVIQHKQM